MRVFATLRPFNHREKEANAELIVSASPSDDGKSCTVSVDPVENLAGSISNRSGSLRSLNLKEAPKPKQYVVDGFFNFFKDKDLPEADKDIGVPLSDLTNVWQRCGQQILENLKTGQNEVVLACGAMGSGKTYALLSQREGQMGIVPQAANELMKMCTETDTSKGSFEVSVVEIYNEKINDLLVARSKWLDGGIKLQPTKDGYSLSAATHLPATDYSAVSAAMEFADRNRSVSSLPWSPCTSRAVTIYQFHYRRETWDSKADKDEKKEGKVTRSTLMLIDMPGRMPSSGANQLSGAAQVEQGNLNKTMSCIERTLSARASGERPSWRDSKATLVMQTVLDANAGLTVLAAVSPASICSHDTIGTLRFVDFLRNGAGDGKKADTTSRSVSPAQGAAASSEADPASPAVAAPAADADGKNENTNQQQQQQQQASPARSASPSPLHPASGPKAVMAYQGPDGQLAKQLPGEDDPTAIRKKIDEVRRRAQKQIDELNAKLTELHSFRRVQAYELPDGTLTTKKPARGTGSHSPRK